MKEYEVIIIGSGPGGYVAAQKAGELGKSVLLIEKDALGGVCTNWGCIPTKSLLASAKLYDHALHSSHMGVVSGDVTFDLTTAMNHKDETVSTLKKGIEFLMKSAKVDILYGEAQLLKDKVVVVEDAQYKGKTIIIATGSSSVVIPIPGANLPHVLTSTEILSIEKLPSSLTVIGGGVIGIEFASLYSMLGVKVTVVEMLDEIIPMADEQIAKLLRREMKEVTFHLKAKVTSIDEKFVHFVDAKGKEQSIESEMVLMSVGRKPNISCLKDSGVYVDKNRVVVDTYMATNIPGVYAIGDVNGESLLAHSASRQADIVAHNLNNPILTQQWRSNAIPWAVYTQPEVAGCGLSEKDASHMNLPVQVVSAQMRSNGRFLAEVGKRASGLCRVVVDSSNHVIVGIQLIGPYSSEMIHSAAIIIESELRVEEVSEIVFPHPSISEVIKDTISSLNTSL